MKYFFDTEFIEDGKTIDLISIGIAAEDGREFYRLNYDCDHSKASDWVKQNVLSQIPPMPLPCYYLSAKEFRNSDAGRQGWRNRESIAFEIQEFCNPLKYGKPEFWGEWCSYDWVVFCQLFGTMMDLPSNFPMYCRNLKQECARLGNPNLPKQGNGEHNALSDALWNKQAWEFLDNIRAAKENSCESE